MPTILLVEDDSSLRETLEYNLRKQEYNVIAAADGQTGLEQARLLGKDLDLMLLDLMLPKMDGFEVCRTLRQEQMNMPILMLTARADEIDRVVGLEIGADDYITKPFSMREVLARVKAALRREQHHREDLKHVPASEADSADDTSAKLLTFGNLTIDPNRREMSLDGKTVALKPKEYELLLYLAQHRGHALTRERLLEQVWGWDYVGGTRTVDVHISWLREKIEGTPGIPTRIVTVRGAGYRFEG